MVFSSYCGAFASPERNGSYLARNMAAVAPSMSPNTVVTQITLRRQCLGFAALFCCTGNQMMQNNEHLLNHYSICYTLKYRSYAPCSNINKRKRLLCK
jgi:hypothetical protein